LGRLAAEQLALLQAAFRFRQQQGCDYYSTRLLSHFLLNCNSGLKVAQIARLLGISRPNASRQQSLPSKAAIGQAHHRMAGRPHGKLLPRYAGPIAAFLLAHPDSTRAALLAFIERTFSVRVSRVALHKFLKKYGLADVAGWPQPQAASNPPLEPPTQTPLPGGATLPPPPPALAAGAPLSAPSDGLGPVFVSLRPSPPPFSSGGRNTPAPSC
jgi:hypothetical protein